MTTFNVSLLEYMELERQVNASQAAVEYLKSNVDQFFLITMGMICYLMQAGFAFLEAGAVRSKNSTNILIKNLMDSFVAGAAYWTIGFPLAYGAGNSFIGYSYWASTGLPANNYAYFFFQYVFAATAATIVSGAMAERCEFVAYFVYSFFITAFVYPVVTHWAWTPEGWLATGSVYGEGNNTYTVAYQDFAGSGVLHVLSGAASFVGALVLGPRIGRFHPDQHGAVDIRGHSVPFAALGGFILLFGFLAFNGGSTVSLVADGGGAKVSLSIVNTIIAGSVSAFVSLGIQKTGYFGNRRWSLLCTLNGALTGMVSVCAGCNVLYPWGAAICGFLAALSFKFISSMMLRLKVDDPLDAVAVHFGGGVCGVISIAFLKREDGILFAWDIKSGLGLAWQVAGLVTIIAWTVVWSVIMFGLLRRAGILRVPEDMERRGLDIPKHGEPAYPMEAYGHGWGEHIMRYINEKKLHTIQKGLVLSGFILPQGMPGMKGPPKSKNSSQTTTHSKGASQTIIQSKGGSQTTPQSKDGSQITPQSKDGSQITPESKDGSQITPESKPTIVLTPPEHNTNATVHLGPSTPEENEGEYENTAL